MQGIETVSIVFENVESIDIPGSRFQTLSCTNLREKAQNHAGREVFECDEILMDISYLDAAELNYEPSEEEYPLGMSTNNPVSNKVVDRPHILGRLLRFNDIAYIELCDKNENTKTIYVP